MLLICMLLFDQKWKQKQLYSFNEHKLVRIAKVITIINLGITVYFLHRLSVTSNISILNLYLENPYFLELNFTSNAILGNFLKTNLFNLLLIVSLKLKGVKIKNANFYIILSIIILLAPNRKGEIIITLLAYIHLILIYRSVNLFKLLKLISLLIVGVFAVFTITYSFYKTAGVKISITNKIYTYLTYPVAGSSFLAKKDHNSFFEYQSLSPVFNKMNILESKNIPVHSEVNFIGDKSIGNVEGIFSPFIGDFGLMGPLLFIIPLILLISFIEQYRNHILFGTFLVIIIAFLDLALFGNYFTNPLLLEMLASLVLYHILYIIRIPSISIKWK